MDQCSLDVELGSLRQSPQYKAYRLKLAEMMLALGVNINGHPKGEHHLLNEGSLNDLNVDPSKS